MLIPLGTDRPQQRTPVVTYTILALNILAFIAMATLERSSPSAHRELLADLWIWGADFRPHALITSAFIHAGWLHLLANMLFLWVFAPNIEDRLSHLGFAAFYLAAAAFSAAVHAFFSDNPAVGASGAIAAVTGAYLVLFPRTHVRCFFFFFIIGFISIPALWLVAINIAWDFLAPAAGSTGVAHLAHIAGYAFGITTALSLLALGILPREPYDLFSALRQARRRAELRRAAQAAYEGPVYRNHDTPEPAEQPDPVALARMRVTTAMNDGDWPAAARAYQALVSEFGLEAALLNRDRLYHLANRLFEIADHDTAALAYQRFLAAWPDDAEAHRISLMLGLIAARSQNDPIAAERHIRRALEGNLSSDETTLAHELLAELGVRP